MAQTKRGQIKSILKTSSLKRKGKANKVKFAKKVDIHFYQLYPGEVEERLDHWNRIQNRIDASERAERARAQARETTKKSSPQKKKSNKSEARKPLNTNKYIKARKPPKTAQNLDDDDTECDDNEFI